MRRSGRPIKRRVYGGDQNQSFEVGESSRGRNQAPYSLQNQNTSNVENPEEEKTILSWLIDLRIIRENAEVRYLDDTRQRILLRGMIRRAGILCLCCKEEITVWEFEIHAASDLKRPYSNIFVAWKLVSLFQCPLEACTVVMGPNQCGFNQVPKENAVDMNDDACMISTDGGDLICCDKCPSTFHQDCLRLEVRICSVVKNLNHYNLLFVLVLTLVHDWILNF